MLSGRLESLEKDLSGLRETFTLFSTEANQQMSQILMMLRDNET